MADPGGIENLFNYRRIYASWTIPQFLTFERVDYHVRVRAVLQHDGYDPSTNVARHTGQVYDV